MSGVAMRGNGHREDPKRSEGDAAIPARSSCPSFPGSLRFDRDDGLGSAERDKQR